jgi:hypothetical protein
VNERCENLREAHQSGSRSSWPVVYSGQHMRSPGLRREAGASSERGGGGACERNVCRFKSIVIEGPRAVSSFGDRDRLAQM